MKKFTKILKESISAEEVEDYFLNIEYIFGKPKIKSYGDDIFEFEWNINLRIDEYNTVDSVDKILDAMSSLREIKTSQSRLLDYNVEFKMTNTLNVKITKKNIDKKNFKCSIYYNRTIVEESISKGNLALFEKLGRFPLVNE